MASVELRIEGLDEFNKKIAELKDVKKVRSRASSSARKAMKLVELSAKMGAAYIDDTETRESIQENIAIRKGKSSNLNTIIMRVGVLGGARNYANTKSNVRKGRAGKQYSTDGSSKNPGGDTFYWRYIEFGTSKMPATPFMRPALEQNIQKVTDEFAKHFMKSIETAIAKGKIT